MKTLMILAGAAGFFYTANAAWKTTKVVDEMTDEVMYCIATDGTSIDCGLFSYRPTLCVRIKPKYYDAATDSMYYVHEQFFTIETEGLKRSGDEIQLRFDSSPAEAFVYSASTDRRAGFFCDAAFKRIMTSTNVLLRYETTLGSIRTTHFSTVGLRDEIEKLKVQLNGTLPPPPAPDPKPTVERPKPKPTAKAAPEKPKVKCSKCSGKGTVKGWTKCVDCNGRGYDGKRCTKCVRSAKTGHVKADVPCSTCSGSGYLSK